MQTYEMGLRVKCTNFLFSTYVSPQFPIFREIKKRKRGVKAGFASYGKPSGVPL